MAMVFSFLLQIDNVLAKYQRQIHSWLRSVILICYKFFLSIFSDNHVGHLFINAMLTLL